MEPAGDIIEAIYAAAGRQGTWDEAIRALAAHLRAANGALYAENLPGDTGPLSLDDFAVEFGYDRRDLLDYAEHYCRCNPFSLYAEHMLYGEPATDDELDAMRIPRFRFEESEFYRDWARPQGVRHILGQYVEDVDRRRLTVAFWRPADAGPYDPAERMMLGGAVKHVRRAIALDARLRLAEAEIKALLDRSRLAVLTLGRNGRIRQTNAAADALLANGAGLLARSGRLRTAVPADQAALDRLVACIFDPRRLVWAENARLPVRRTDGGAPFVVRIAACAQGIGPFAADRTASAVLTVEGLDVDGAKLRERLARRFAMTPAQTRLALVLRSGHTLAAAAAELGISYETARSHLKAVFACTDTRRQAELVLLLREIEDR
ncbi:helix-turn-helix transcriptional regulator [Aureimonas leprariae]|uniref:Helix-turn-helix transcriptional regulator n=1 Tax=Plantimonas leprariae TaxID=2615207 RepID=A0A7V7PTF1_9HYPH|nr:helix-turn-helix transcriptional regulator [Aureimonas leprariae]KAB0682961.1 helix-turn-helix transcriptional regulator [Aureimonas leprariae]